METSSSATANAWLLLSLRGLTKLVSLLHGYIHSYYPGLWAFNWLRNNLHIDGAVIVNTGVDINDVHCAEKSTSANVFGISCKDLMNLGAELIDHDIFFPLVRYYSGYLWEVHRELQPLIISCTSHLGPGEGSQAFVLYYDPWEAVFSAPKDIVELFLDYFDGISNQNIPYMAGGGGGSEHGLKNKPTSGS
jgi:hypothetical protein